MNPFQSALQWVNKSNGELWDFMGVWRKHNLIIVKWWISWFVLRLDANHDFEWFSLGFLNFDIVVAAFCQEKAVGVCACARGPDSFQFLFLFSPSLLRLVAVIATSCRKNQAGLIIWRLIFLAPVEFSNNSHTWHHQTREHLYKSQLFDNTGGYFYCGESFTLKVFYHTSLLLPSRRAAELSPEALVKITTRSKLQWKCIYTFFPRKFSKKCTIRWRKYFFLFYLHRYRT